MSKTMRAWQYRKGVTARNLNHTLESSIVLNAAASAPDSSSLCPNEVLVEVVSAALNHIDYKLPESDSLMKTLGGLPGDSQPGVDFSGRVVDTHPSCKQFAKGQRVCGSLAKPGKWGALGELLVASTSELVLLPDSVSFDDAASLGVAAGTAYKVIERIRTGAHVFVNGGSGAVGTFAVQLARLFGASIIIATASAANRQTVKVLGADRVVDYKSTPDIVREVEKGEHFDLVVDAAGSPASLYSQSHRILCPSGSFVQVAAHPTCKGMIPVLQNTIRSSFLGPRFRFVMDNGSQDSFQQMVQWIEEGKLQPIIGQVYEFEQVPAAYAKLRQGTSGGRVVVHVKSKGGDGGTAS